MRIRFLALALSAAVLTAGCYDASQQSNSTPSSTSTSATMLPPANTGAAPAAPGGNMHKLASGLQYEDVVVGSGTMAEPGMSVSVHYTGRLTDGSKFDSSLDRGQPLKFQLGSGQVIDGWEQGIKGMRIGGKRKLTIPPDLAYGARGSSGVIPPYATLLFDIELIDVQ